jgi:hypothetical protein
MSGLARQNIMDLIGQQFGRLIVQDFAGRTNGVTWWHCICDCGKQRDVRAGNLRSGRAQSCGCLKRERGIEASTIHGYCHFKEYPVWCAMVRRCGNPKDKSFKHYGGRGIIVCQRWQESFELFCSDMGERPPGHTIERKDNDGPYEPGNCVWLPLRLQNRNQRQQHNNTTGVTGVIRHKLTGKWRASIGHEGKKLHLGLFPSLADAAAARAAAMERLGYPKNHGSSR